MRSVSPTEKKLDEVYIEKGTSKKASFFLKSTIQDAIKQEFNEGNFVKSNQSILLKNK